MQDQLKAEKQRALLIAKQLFYDKEIVERIKKAENKYQIDRALSEGRHRL